MKPSDLPRAKPLALGERLRTLLSQAADEALRDASGQKATRLHALVTAVATAVASIRDLTAPTVVSRTQAFGVAQIAVLYSENLDPDWVPVPADWTISSPSRTVTGVAVDGRRVLISYSGAVLLTADTPDIAYVQNANAGHRDNAGNLAASFTAAAVTVAGA